MHVVFSLDNMNPGGTELNAVRTAERLVARGVDLRLVTLQDDGPLRSRFEELGVPIQAFTIDSLMGRRAVAQAWRLRRFLRQLRPDVVHAHDMYSNILTVPTARLAGVPLVIASRRWWVAPERKHQILNRWAYKAAHAVLVNSPSVGKFVRERERVSQDRIEVIPNFLDAEAFDPPAPKTLRAWRDELGIPDSALVIGSVANLLPVKDHLTLLRAVASVRRTRTDAHLALVGEGEMRPQLEALARKLGIADHVTLAGRRPSQPSFHHLFDISVLTSTSEGLPNSLLEAMAAARPVVATEVGAITDIIDDSVGRLVPASDPDAVAAALLELARDPDLRVRLGTAGRARARADHSAEAVIDRLTALYARGARAPAGSQSVQSPLY